MIRYTLAAAALATLLTSSAIADDGPKRGDDDRNRSDFQTYRKNDRRDDNRGNDDRRDDRRRDDDSQRHDGWRPYDNVRQYENWRRDGWRYDRGRDDNYWRRGRDWRYAPPVRYRADYGYRYGYELAWRDWDRYGRNDRRWHRRPESRYRFDYGYLSGYDAGWRDAGQYFGYGYRPRYWSRDPYGSWFFSFSLSG